MKDHIASSSILPEAAAALKARGRVFRPAKVFARSSSKALDSDSATESTGTQDFTKERTPM